MRKRRLTLDERQTALACLDQARTGISDAMRIATPGLYMRSLDRMARLLNTLGACKADIKATEYNDILPAREQGV